MSGKWTKGPWLYRGKSDDVYTAPPEGTDYSYGNFIFGFRDECVPNDADLALILAAPNLYDALADLLAAYEDPGSTGSDHDNKVIKARVALAAARGEGNE